MGDGWTGDGWLAVMLRRFVEIGVVPVRVLRPYNPRVAASLAALRERCRLATEDITAHLDAWQRGDRGALDAAMPGLYQTLRSIAIQRLNREAGVVLTLEPTDLVHEAMARMLGAQKAYANRAHFLAVAALYMRSILTDRARAIVAGRRPGAGMSVAIDAIAEPGEPGVIDLLALDEALRRLEHDDARAARVLEMVWFSGMSQDEIAEVLRLSPASIGRDLRYARAWVNRALA